MNGKMLIYIISLSLSAFILFFSWHYLLSIYEVRYKTSFKNDSLTLNTSYSIKCLGLNSLGWELEFRDLKCNYKVISGNNYIKIDEITHKNEFVFTPHSSGLVVIQANSEFSLNPSKFKLNITNMLTQ